MDAIRKGLLGALCATLLFAAPKPAEATSVTGALSAAQYGARVWIEGEPSYFNRGDRLNVRFSVPSDAYVAVVHIDSDGVLDFLYPRDPWDDGFVRAGRVHSISRAGSFASTTIRSRAGIGYLFLIASPIPLDYRYFAGRPGSPWDWGYAGRNVYGDPFLAFDQLARLLVPGWHYGDYYYDYHSYHVEGIHRYPSFACSDRRYSYGWGWYPEFDSCSRIDSFLRRYPDYYDARRFRGDRRFRLRPFERLDPRHGFKEAPDRRGFDRRAPAPPPPASGRGGPEVPRRDAVPARPAPSAPERGASPPARPPATRPDRGGSPAASPPPASRRPTPESGADRRAPAPSSGRAQPAANPRPAPSGRGATEPAPAGGSRTRPAPNSRG